MNFDVKSRDVLYWAAYILWLASGLCLLNVFLGIGGQDNRLRFGIIGFVLAYVANEVWQAAQRYMETKRDELQVEHEVEFNKNQLEKERVRSTQIKNEAREDIRLINTTNYSVI